MAKIPEYQQQFDKQNVELGAPKQQLNIPAAAFGSDGKALQEAGKGLQDAGSVLAAVRTRMGEEEAQAKANAALTRHIETTTPYMAYVSTTKGEEAYGVTDGTREHLRGEAEKIANELGPGLAQDLFKKAAESHFREGITKSSLHETQQRQEYRFTSADALAVSEGQNALTNFNSAQLFESGLVRALEKKQEALAVKGFGPESEQAKNALSAFSSTMVRARAQTYLGRGAYGEAQAIATNDTRLLPQDREALEKEIKPLATLGRAQEVYDRLKGMGEGAIRAIESDKTIDPDVRQKALELVDRNVSRQRASVQFNQHQGAIALSGRIVKAYQAGDIVGAQKLADTAPLYAAPGASELVTKLSSGSMRPDEGGPAGLVWDLRRKAAENPAAFMDDWAQNRVSYAARLSAHSQSLFDNLFTAAHKGDSKPMEEFITDQAILKGTAAQLGIIDNGTGRVTDQKKLDQLEVEYARAMTEATLAKGGKLTTEEKYRVRDKQILLPGTVEGIMYGRNAATKFGAKLDGRASFEANKADIPPKPAGAPKNAYWDHALGSYVFERNDGVVFKYTGSNK